MLYLGMETSEESVTLHRCCTSHALNVVAHTSRTEYLFENFEMVGQIPAENVDVVDHPALQVSFTCSFVLSHSRL
jgi:hypothetical protein